MFIGSTGDDFSDGLRSILRRFRFHAELHDKMT